MKKRSLLLSVGIFSDKRPETFQDLKNGQGSFLYNHNIKEVLVIEDEDGSFTITNKAKQSTGKKFQYDSLRCEYPRTGDNVFATLLSETYPPQKESQLLNEYKSAEIGLLDESYKQPYEDFLQHRIELRAMVEADCLTHKIPLP